MANGRSDLSDWLIHFVHGRNVANEPNRIFSQEEGNFPYHADSTLDSRFQEWHNRDRTYSLDIKAGPVSVLSKILDDGHIRASWSFRGSRATIYGPRVAVCLTEMPLHALLSYAAARRDSRKVADYGIGLLKREAFAAGARPVIYGITGRHAEVGDTQWPRTLAPSCGIAEHEQFRYVATNIDGTRRIDWTHEREWRWADVEDRCSVPGLPVWLAQMPWQFSQALILVKTADEAEALLNKIKQLFDAGCNEYDEPYNVSTLRNTRVIVLDDIVNAAGDEFSATLRIEDIPAARQLRFVRPAVTQELISRVRSAIGRARTAAYEAAEAYRAEAFRRGTLFSGPYGFAFVMVFDPQSALTEALLQLQIADAIGGVGYTIRELSHLARTGGLWEAEDAAYAAVAVLEAEFPDSVFWVRTELD